MSSQSDAAVIIVSWILTIIAAAVAILEYVQKGRLERSINQSKRTTFESQLRKGMDPFAVIKEIDCNAIVDFIGKKSVVSYFKATGTQDQKAIEEVWEGISTEVADQIHSQLVKLRELPIGFKETVAFLFLIRYAEDRAKQLIIRTLNKKALENNVARYYYSLTDAPSSIEELLAKFTGCTESEVARTIATLRGEELERISHLFEDERWNRKLTERLRQFVSSRKLSYQSLLNTLVTGSTPRLFIVLKNEGKEESEEEEIRNRRIIAMKLKEFRDKGKMERVVQVSSVHFVRDPTVVDEFLDSLPMGQEHNYAVFSAEMDPSTMRIKTPDRLEGNPSTFFFNIEKYSDVKRVYQELIIKLGISPREIIETADLGFLLDAAPEVVVSKLRSESQNVLRALSGDGYKVTQLTDLRTLDEDGVGLLAKHLGDLTGIMPSQARAYSTEMVEGAADLHAAIYASLK